MIKQFVPAEFYYFTRDSLLQQFEKAYDIIKKDELTAAEQTSALKYLADTNSGRWKYICDHINNIDNVRQAIMFLKNSPKNGKSCCPDGIQSSCRRRPDPFKIKLAIEVAESIYNYKKDILTDKQKIKNLDDKLATMNSDMSDLNEKTKKFLPYIKKPGYVSVKQRRNTFEDARKLAEMYATSRTGQEEKVKLEEELKKKEEEWEKI